MQPFASSSRKESFLVWFPCGRVLEVSKPLADMLALMDGSRSIAEIAGILSAAGPRRIAPSDVEDALALRLMPAGLLALDSAPVDSQSRGRRKGRARGMMILSARCLAPVTRRLTVLFSAPVRIPLLLLAALCSWVLVREVSVAGSAIQPFRLAGREAVALYGLLLGSVLFHELGHLSALRFHGGEHGEMRMGLYIVFPVLYANVTRAWGLSRKARVDVDLGGVYFQILLAIPSLAAYWLSPSPIWPCLCAGILSMTALAVNPFFRFDGYWVCSDLLGVPNLRERSRRYLRQVWMRVREGSSAGAVGVLDLGRAEAVGLLLYGILSHLFFLGATFLFARFVFFRPGGPIAILEQGPVQVFEAMRTGDLWEAAARLPGTAAVYAAAYGMVRFAWQGMRMCSGRLRSARVRNQVRGRSRSGGRAGLSRVGGGGPLSLVLLTLLVGWAAGCGEWTAGGSGAVSAEEGAGAEPSPERMTCEDLERSREEATGGRFSCLSCMRTWRWQAPALSGSLLLFVEYSVESASGEVSLRFLRPDGSVLWESRAHAGDKDSVCLTDADPQEGLYELCLSGEGPFGLLPSFRGSVWAKVGSEQSGLLDSVRP